MSGRRIRRLLVAALLAALALVAVGIGLKALEVRRFRQVLLSCEIGSPACGAEAIARLERRTGAMARGWRFDAETFELLARAHVVLARHALDLPGQRARLKQGLAAIDRAIEARPRWPYAHVARLGILVQLGDLDAASDAAWRNAWRFGPNEKRVLRALAEAHVAYRAAGRPSPVDPAPMLARLAARDRAFLVGLAVRHGERDMLCGPTGVLPADPVCQADPNR